MWANVTHRRVKGSEGRVVSDRGALGERRQKGSVGFWVLIAREEERKKIK
jgi:hypothetical protein